MRGGPGQVTMAAVTTADATARVADLTRGARRLAARPDWPLVSGLALGAAAVAEAIVYTAGVAGSEDSAAVVFNCWPPRRSPPGART
jgi:hypothetical protein